MAVMKTILVALDASPRSPYVLAEAIAIATRTSARLVLVRAVPLPVELPTDAYIMPPTQLGPMLLQSARKALEELAAAVPAPMGSPTGVETRVELGTPWTVICDEAKRVDADLVVIGSHGYSTMDRLLGTTASRVVNHIDRSVLVVRLRQPVAAG